eukprot:jgi/Chrzof1/6816/UNPLg00883.t1
MLLHLYLYLAFISRHCEPQQCSIQRTAARTPQAGQRLASTLAPVSLTHAYGRLIYLLIYVMMQVRATQQAYTPTMWCMMRSLGEPRWSIVSHAHCDSEWHLPRVAH